MTIANHIRKIQKSADQVIEHMDDREYNKAHSALDDIAMSALAAHRHIDNLQSVADCAARPAGGDGT